MKNLKKAVISSVLALVFAAITLSPVTMKAAVKYDKEQTVYMSSNTAEKKIITFCVEGLGEDEIIKSVKCDKTSVAKPWTIHTTTEMKNTKIEFSQHIATDSEGQSMDKYAYIALEALKKGKVNVSFKVYNTETKESSTHEVKLNIKPYTNPINTIKIAGIKKGKGTNLAGKMKNENIALLNLKKTKKNASVYIKANRGWKIKSVFIYNEYREARHSVSYFSHPVSSVKFSDLGTFKANKSVHIGIEFINTKNGAKMENAYYINSYF